MKHLLASLKFPLLVVAMISTGVNALMLVSPIFMMQVYDRVLASGHLETLVSLTSMAVLALLILGLFEGIRQQVLSRTGDWLERKAGDIIIDTALENSAPTSRLFQHIKAVRRFVCAPPVFSLLDAPWSLIFAALLWWMHPWLGAVAFAGAVALLCVAFTTEFVSRRPLADSQKYQSETQLILSSTLRNSDAIKSMGMAGALKQRWADASNESYTHQAVASERSAFLSGLAKAVRLIVQTAILAVGAYLVLQGEITGGGMIASSTLLGRCLAPVEQSIGAWKGFLLARDAWQELVSFGEKKQTIQSMDLPTPKGEVKVDGLGFQTDPQYPPILDNISLSLCPGNVLCLIGPSGSGKTTLSRMLVGALAPTTGEVRLDERSLQGWNPQQLGKYIGYLPQGVEMLPGTLKDNIQRFGADDPEGVVAAAQAAQVDELIRNLPNGYETVIDPHGPPVLSAGQLQRIALARALYGQPKLIVLDEPNANLDVAGEHALFKAVRMAADGGASVVVVSHRPALLEVADQVAVLQAGRIAAIGPREEILKPRAVKKTTATNEINSSNPSLSLQKEGQA